MSGAAKPRSGGTLRLGKPLPPAAAAAIARTSGKQVAATKTTAKPPPAAKTAAKPATSLKLKLKTPPPTPASAAKQRAAWMRRDLVRCRERWPAVFNDSHPLPLAIGVDEALVEALGNRKRTERMLANWTRRLGYLAAVAAGGARYNLDGSVSGEITDHQRSVAQAALIARNIQEAA